MYLASPRIPPVLDSEWTQAQRAQLEPMGAHRPVLNIFKTLAHDPEGAGGVFAWGSYILSKRNALPAREREIVILRIGFLCRAGYEWTQHAPIGVRAGLTAAELERIKGGASVAGWSAADAALLLAADDLHHRQFIADETWAALRQHFDEKQCMAVVFTAGQYTQVSMMLNSFGVQLDEGQTLDPDLKAY